MAPWKGATEGNHQGMFYEQNIDKQFVKCVVEIMEKYL